MSSLSLACTAHIPSHLEAIRKPFRLVVARSSRILAVMKGRAITRREPVQHKMYITDLYHSSTGFYTTLIVLAVPTIPTMPGVRPLNDPAFRQRRKAFRRMVKIFELAFSREVTFLP